MRKDIFKLGILIVLAAFSAFSCQKEIDINTSALENQYVIEGAIKVGQLPYVILTKTGFLYDPIDVAALEEAYIHGAVVTVTDGSKTVTLSEVCYKNYNFFLTTELIDSLANLGGTTPDSLRLFLASLSNAQMDSLIQFFGVPADVLSNIPLVCVYAMPSDTSFLGEEGKQYSLTVKVDGKTLTSKTTIPTKYIIDSLTYEYNDNHPEYAQAYVNLTLNPNASLGNYVKFGSRKQGENFHFGGIGGSVYSDAAFDGATSLSLPLPAKRVEDRPVGTDFLFEKGDTAFLYWANIDKSTYDFLFSAENDGGATPFSSPSKIISNINGGLGMWGGYNESTYKVYIP